MESVKRKRRKPKETERNRKKPKDQISNTNKSKKDGTKKQKDSDRDLCTRHFTFFSFYLFITTVKIIKLEQHRGTVEEEKISS